MHYSRSVKVSVLKKVLPPESRSVRSVSQETGIGEQTTKHVISCGEIKNGSPYEKNKKKRGEPWKH